MDDLISRAAALDVIDGIKPMQGNMEQLAIKALCWAAVKSIPAADAVPVVHRRWMATDAYPHNVYCSECYKTFAQTHWAVWEDGSLPRNYCPNCGARMDGERRDEDGTVD